MSMVNSASSRLLLVSILSILCRCDSYSNKNYSGNLDIIHLRDYILAFEHCTTMVFTTEEVSLAPTSTRQSPIILYVYNTSISLMTGESIPEKFSMIRRRNSRPHCWATISILPERAGLFNFLFGRFFFDLPNYISLWQSHYFIIVTEVKDHVVIYFSKYQDFLPLHRLTEILLVDVTKGDNLLLTFEYFNAYHADKPNSRIKHSEVWYHIMCVSADCFDHIVRLGKNTSRLNKYFWTTKEMFDKYISLLRQVRLSEMILRNNSQSILYARETYKRIADVFSFHDFLIYLVLQDVLTFGHAGQRAHTLFPIGPPGFFYGKRFAFLMDGVQKYGFVSCYGLGQTPGILGTLSSPFDVTSWRYLGICMITVVLILTSILRRSTFDGLFLVVGLTLENSATLSVQEARPKVVGHTTFGVSTLVAIWSMLVGIILTNYYKTWFTMEMIVPTVYVSPWKNILDEDIRIFMPFETLLGNAFRILPSGDFYRYYYFYAAILNYCYLIIGNSSNLSIHGSERKIAHKLFFKLLPHFGMDDKLRDVQNGTFSVVGNEIPFFSKSSLLDYPIQPVEYDDQDGYGVLKALRACGKVALMDTEENILAIKKYLNYHHQDVTYVSGAAGSFFSDFRGWTMPQVRNNYVEERLNVFITSGILTRWKSLYNSWQPINPLARFANRTGRNVAAVSRIEYSSKVTTGFYALGICVIICILVFYAELVKYKYSMRLIYWVDYVFGKFN